MFQLNFVIRSNVTALENAFAEYYGARHAVAVCNGTVALHPMLFAAGSGEEGEVIMPSSAMAFLAFAGCYGRAIPVFVDPEMKTWDMNVDHIKE